MSTATAKFRTLEAGRFVAALLVVLCHVAPEASAHGGAGQAVFGGITFPGPLGVQFFFALSGFVMVCAHHGDFGHVAAIPRFWWRRACRIYPAYWLALSIPLYFLRGSVTPGLAAELLTLDPWHSREFILAAWSLRYELAFYLVLGLGMLPYLGKPFLGLWALLTYWRWGWPYFPFTVLPAPPRVLLELNGLAGAYAPDFVSFFQFYFFGGLAVGWVFVRWRLPGWVWAGLLAAGLAGAAVLLPGEGWGVFYGSPMHVLLMGLALACMVGGLAGLERAGFLRLGDWASGLGAVSYPLYIVHMPLLLLAGEILPLGRLGGVAMYGYFAALLLGILAVAVAVTFWFDQPVQRALRRLEPMACRALQRRSRDLVQRAEAE